MSDGTHIDLPEPSPEMAEHRAALADGRLTFQRCATCGNAWLPPRDHCPRCLAADPAWEQASGTAKIISWVVYHRSYHPAFMDRVPYNVVVVELAEGPRMISNVLGLDPAHPAEGLQVDAALKFVPDTEGDVPVARFELM